MRSNLDEAVVRHVASLAGLAISDSEVCLYSEQLSKILNYVDQLNEVDTSAVPPTAHPLSVTNVFRDDLPHESWTPEKALADAPQQRDGFFCVPKVLEE